jgi:N-acyl-D-aspartate/D-glutamate deacylase
MSAGGSEVSSALVLQRFNAVAVPRWLSITSQLTNTPVAVAPPGPADTPRQTEVVGQDGISYAPVRSKTQLRAIREQIAGWNGNPTDEECATTLASIGMFEWDSIRGYLDCLERNRTATNVAMLVPQGNLRLLACGPYDTPASNEEIMDQVELLRKAMAEGAVGMSR